MSDELQVQHSSSSTPYAVTGGLLGGAAGGFGAHYLTKPKYGSYEEIIKEAKDSTDFSSKIEKAEGDEKKFLEAAKDLAEKRTAAETEYDKDFEAWKKENPTTEKNVDAKYEELKAAQTKAEEELEAKKKTLIDEQIEIIKNQPVKEGEAALTEEQIKQKATEAVKESAYKKETKAVNAAKKAAEDYYKTLPDGKALTAEELEAAFLKDKCSGAESKAKYIDGKIEESATKFKNDFKTWLERKWGFAEHTNLKLAGVAVAGALVLGGIAAALAPKNKG